MSKMKSLAPTQKVTIASAAAAVATIAASIIVSILPKELKQVVPNLEVELVTIITFLAGYFMPPSPGDDTADET